MFRGGISTSISCRPIANNYPATEGGQYSVQPGDTLEAIALSTYGDGSLWYLITQANGLSGDADLRVGESLSIPSVVGDVHNNASTNAPYDASKYIGGLAPTTPTPQCKGIGEILVVVAAASAIVMKQGATGLLDWDPNTATPASFGTLIAGDNTLGDLVGQAMNVEFGYQKSINLGRLDPE